MQSSAYLSCCTADFMAPEEEVCGKTIDDFPEIPKGDLTPDQIQQINDVCTSYLTSNWTEKACFLIIKSYITFKYSVISP